MRLARWTPLLAVVVIAGCGSSGDTPEGGNERLNLTTPKDPTVAAPKIDPSVTRQESAVIRGWTDNLRAGHVKRAARYFALPSVVANGTPLLTIRTRAQAEQFNRLLVCGAKVVALERAEEHRVLATFRLTERPGGFCGDGTGHLAHTAFRIEGGRITQWLRADEPGPQAESTPS
jgi:hypothetical protein